MLVPADVRYKIDDDAVHVRDPSAGALTLCAGWVAEGVNVEPFIEQSVYRLCLDRNAFCWTCIKRADILRRLPS